MNDSPKIPEKAALKACAPAYVTDADLVPSGNWSAKHGTHVDRMIAEIGAVFDRYNDEYDVGWLELIGALELLKARMMKVALEDDDEAPDADEWKAGND